MKRIQELEKEIKEFETLQIKKQQEFQQIQDQFQKEIVEIGQGILTRRGGVIELQKLEKKAKDVS